MLFWFCITHKQSTSRQTHVKPDQKKTESCLPQHREHPGSNLSYRKNWDRNIEKGTNRGNLFSSSFLLGALAKLEYAGTVITSRHSHMEWGHHSWLLKACPCSGCSGHLKKKHVYVSFSSYDKICSTDWWLQQDVRALQQE